MNERIGLVIAAAVLAGGLPGIARADRLDDRLHKEMPAIIQKLKEQGHKNVGVLRFRVTQLAERGKAKSTFAAPLSGSLAGRVENLLIINGGPDVDKALGVIRDATSTAARHGVTGWTSSSAARRKLFDADYQLAWDSDKVKASVFLTGEVVISPDLKKTTLTLWSFDRKSPDAQAQLARLTLNTDRNVLRDLGYSFQMTRKNRMVARRSGGSPIVIEELPEDVDGKGTRPAKKDEKDDEEGPQPKPDQVTRPVNVGGVELQMLVDGMPYAFVERGGPDGAAWQVKCPPAGKTVQFRLKNNSTKRLAAVLRLNGVNTINEQQADPERCGKWILDAGRSALVKGFLLLGEATGGTNEVIPIKVLVGAEASKIRAEMGDKAGLIQLDVFEEGTDEPGVTVTPRGLPPSKDKAARASYVSLRDALLKSAGLKKQMVKSREILGPDRSGGSGPGYDRVKVIPFGRPKLIASVTVKVVPAETPE